MKKIRLIGLEAKNEPFGESPVSPRWIISPILRVLCISAQQAVIAARFIFSRHHNIALFSLFVMPICIADAAPPMPLNLAHRGLSWEAPENTLMAFKLAIQVGSNGAECDVHRTSDGVLILSHDRNIKRTMGQDVDITTKTFAEVQQFEAGKWKGRHFAGEKVPTLEEYLLLLKGSTCTPVIELKQLGIEKDVVELLRKHNMIDDVFIVSFNSEALAEIKRLEPKLAFAHIFSWKVEGDAADQAEDLARRLIEGADKVGTKTVSLEQKMVSKELVDIMHGKGYFVWVWTVNSVPDMERFLDWNLDSVTSDRPDVLADVIEKRKAK